MKKYPRNSVRLATTSALILISLLNMPGAGRRTEASASAAHSNLPSGVTAVQLSLQSYGYSVGMNLDGRSEVFALDGDGMMWHNWQTSPLSFRWSGWLPLTGVPFTGIPSVANNQYGGLVVFAIGRWDQSLWVRHHVPGGRWSDWESLGGLIYSSPVVGRNADGSLEVFVRWGDSAVWHNRQLFPNSSHWSGWESLGGSTYDNPAVGYTGDGRLVVFARGSDNAVWLKWQLALDRNSWSDWKSLGGSTYDNPVVGHTGDGRLVVFVRGSDNAVWVKWQFANNGPWSGWKSLGGSIYDTPTVVTNNDGRMEVFVRGSNNEVWHTWQFAHNGSWSDWESLYGVAWQSPRVARYYDGSLRVFTVWSGNTLRHIYRSGDNIWNDHWCILDKEALGCP